MRTRHALDSLEEPKWGLASNLALQQLGKIIYVGMTVHESFTSRYKRAKRIGGDWKHQAVTKIYKPRRAVALRAAGELDDACSVTALMVEAKQKLPLSQVVDDEVPFTHAGRRAYFERAVEIIRADRDHPAVVFVDPCTGIAIVGKGDHRAFAGPSSGKHVGIAELEYVWDALRSNDVLLVYQHRATRYQENMDWLLASAGRRSRAITCTRSLNARHVCTCFDG